MAQDRDTIRTVSLKTAGQDASLRTITRPEERAFRAILTALRPGSEFTTNDIRADLERAEIKPGQRGGLMRNAIRDGLIEQVTLRYRGHDVPVTFPSDLAESHADRVNLYRRCLTQRLKTETLTPVPAATQQSLDLGVMSA